MINNIFENLQAITDAQIQMEQARAEAARDHESCRGCRRPYPKDDQDAEEMLKPFPICDSCLEALKPIYEKRGEL